MGWSIPPTWPTSWDCGQDICSWICLSVWSPPLELHSDQGPNFESALFQEVCRLFEIVKTRSSPYHPSSNGLVERFNRTLAALIRSYLESRLHDWDSFIPLLTSAYRSTTHPSTGFSPNFLMFGQEVTAPVDLLFPRPSTTLATDIPTYVQDLRERLHECYELAREKLRVAAERQKRDHDTRVVQNHFSPGDLVLKRNHNHKKLETPWVGPFVVKKVMGDCLYLVASKQKTYVLHHDLLKPYTGSQVPRWVRGLPANNQHWMWVSCCALPNVFSCFQTYHHGHHWWKKSPGPRLQVSAMPLVGR